MSTENAVTLSVPASMEVTFTPGRDGSMQVTIAPRAPAGRPSQVTLDALDAHRREQRAAAVVRRGRPPGSGKGQKGHGVSGQDWHDKRARNAAIRAFADADPRFSRADYRSPGADGKEEGYYISSRLRRAWEEAQAGPADPAQPGAPGGS